MSGRHEPVLLAEALRFLRNGPGLYLDATLGDAGHAEALLESEPNSRLLGCDRDAEALAGARIHLARFGERVMLAHTSFRELPDVHRRLGGEPLTGALFDLGLSSRQIDQPQRGMSFMHDGPLDLRMDRTRGPSAAEWLAGAAEGDIERALREHGDVRGAASLARRLADRARRGELRTTGDMVRALTGPRGGRPHPRFLAQVFQALRVEINGEDVELETVLAWLPRAMRPGGVVVTLAYHSGEDRRIKRALRETRGGGSPRRLPAPIDAPRPPEGAWEALTRRVVTSTPEERKRNPRSRSVRLRAFRRKP